jgi:hypothetical protein
VRHALLVILALSAGPAFAADVSGAVVADDDEDLFKDESEKKGNNGDIPDAASFKDEDDMDIPTFEAPVKVVEKVKAAPAAPANVGMPADIAGKEVLADNWGPQVVVADKDAVVVEMPVLYARNRAGFDGVAYWLVAEAFADGKRVAQSRVEITTDAVADKGPSIQFFRLFTPVPSAAGVIVVNVSKAASATAKPTLLFTRSVNYKL